MPKPNQEIKLIVLSALLYSANCHADIYKCVDTDGSITYAQTPCSDSQIPARVTARNATQDTESADCRHASKFAYRTARAMKNGTGSRDVFDHYGGVDAVSSGTINLINYVYTHRFNEGVSAERIAGLSEAKCQARSLGDVACESLPPSYTESLGGCDAEDLDSISEDASADRQPAEFTAEQVYPGAVGTDEPGQKEAEIRAETNSRQCRERYQAQIDQLDEQMRKGYTSAQGDAMREQRRDLGNKKRNCA